MSLYPYMAAMLVSGSCCTLLMKYMVMQQIPDGPGKAATGFDFPFLQTEFMMVGEVLCLVAFMVTVARQTTASRVAAAAGAPAPSWVFLVPTACDWTATTCVNMAYTLIPASVIQMTRGAIVMFTCALSVTFLKRRQHAYHFAGVGLVVAGISLVSLAALHKDTGSPADSQASSRKAGMGIFLCVAAQVFQATMIVYEEHVMSKYPVAPLKVVGMEGLFGVGMGVLILTAVNSLGMEDTSAAVYQMHNSNMLLLAICGSIISIMVFNWCGVTVTQQASATARSTLDVSRTMIIWAAELALGWNTFSRLQLAGFVLVALGTLLYNRLIVLQALEPAVEVASKEERLSLLRDVDVKEV